MASVALFVFVVSLLFLIFGEELANTYDVIGIRIATLFIAFAAFCSTSLFSMLIYYNNRIVRQNNDDTNKRAELFREMQFASANYTLVDFIDTILIQKESDRYINKYVLNNSLKFHMLEEGIFQEDIFKNFNNYNFFTLSIPYHIVEGKMVANISFEKMKFERNNRAFRFVTPNSESDSSSFLLYNECIKNYNAIINLVTKKDSEFFRFGEINSFSKIKVNMKITSLLGVNVKGIIELYFTNPERKESDDSNAYKINSSNFFITELPNINDSSYYENINNF